MLVMSTAAQSNTPAPVVVNGLAVPRAEFGWFMQQVKPGVIQFYKQKYNLEFGPGFWGKKRGGLTPRTLLQNRTRERVVREKVEQLLFKELGLIPDASYATFLDELVKTNRQRASAKSQGKVIYGPVNYTQLQYFDHSKAIRQMQAREILGRDRLVASEAELRAAYEKNKKPYTSAPVSSWEIAALQSAGTAGDPEVETQIATAAKSIHSRLKSGASVQQLKHEFGKTHGLVFTSERLADVEAERLAEMFSDGDTFARMQKLKPDRVTVLPASAGVTRVVKCVTRKPGELQPFEKVRAQVQKQVLRKNYEVLITELATKADVKIDQSQIDLIPIE